MAAAVIRLARPGEEKQLKAIWCDAYDGDAAGAEAYFHFCYRPELCVAAEAEGELRSAIYRIEGFVLRSFGTAYVKADYLYSLGTPKRFRGQGLGSAVTRRIVTEGLFSGADCVFLCPAEDSLARWYETMMGGIPSFFHRSAEICSEGTPSNGSVTAINAAEYGVQREVLLAGHPHTAFPENALRLQEEYCRMEQGGFCRVRIGNLSGICAWDRQKDKLILRELLLPGVDPADAARFLLSKFGGQKAEVRVPAFWHANFGRITPDILLMSDRERFPSADEIPYWGLFMD